MMAVALGTAGMSLLFNAVGSATNPWYAVPFWWHMVLGGWAFAAAFMATDPVTSPFSDAGKWVYGILIGAFVVGIRVLNPAYPESVMLVILFMNVMAPLIDHGFVRANVRRRQRRLQQQRQPQPPQQPQKGQAG
jgi:Na+-transporting NADH:ubiquinone oxidoreductase subunit B